MNNKYEFSLKIIRNKYSKCYCFFSKDFILWIIIKEKILIKVYKLYFFFKDWKYHILDQILRYRWFWRSNNILCIQYSILNFKTFKIHNEYFNVHVLTWKVNISLVGSAVWTCKFYKYTKYIDLWNLTSKMLCIHQ